MNIKIPSYIIPIIIIICFSSLIGFLIYKSYFKPVQEGLETRIMREDGKLVKRRKKKSIREGLDDPVGDAIRESIENTKRTFEQAGESLKKSFEIFNEVTKGFKKMSNFFNSIGDIFSYIPKLCKYLAWYIGHVFENITQAFLYIPAIFKWLGSYITGGMKFITNMNKCFGWYVLDIIGQIYYSPFKFIFWLFNLQSVESFIWDIAESIDCSVRKYTGYHLIHYSDSIIDRCYSFCPDEFPRFPDLDWGFHPPTLNLDTNW
uniref:Uncharacterized protein n=1 Tax=viral metagenome TaxID=1070528 RepID=A0A6C0HGR0_9ZZZZ